MKPLRVLQVVTIMNRGGLETMLMNYYRAIDRDQIQFDFMVHRTERGHYDDEIEELGGRIFRMPPIRPGNYSLYFKKLDFFFEENHEYRIVHSHINENSSFVLRAAKKANVPIRIAHSHASGIGLDIKIPFRLYARSYIKNNTNHYIACSRNAGKWLFGKKVLESADFTILKNAVNAKDFIFNPDIREQVRKELEISNELVIGHVGRFNRLKNHEFLIDVFKLIHQKKENSILILVGEGELKEKIQRKVERLGLSSNVKFLGLRDDIPKIMQSIDLFLFPSIFEGLPVALVEAQAAGIKCIVSDTISKEVDLTGRVEFISLKKSPHYWSTKVLTSRYTHIDTLEKIREEGFDTETVANWLSDFYLNSYKMTLSGGSKYESNNNYLHSNF